MILTDKIKVKVSQKNITHFQNIGLNIVLKEIIEISPTLLNKGSHLEIDVKCDICGLEKKLSYISYRKNIENSNFYACSSKCAQEKVKKTSIEKFGEEYYMKTKEYKNVIQETSIKNYGCNHYTQNQLVKNKLIKTNYKKYGVSCVFKNEEIKQKIKKTNLNSYNVDNPSKCEQVKNKIRRNVKKWNELKYLEIYKKWGVISLNYEKNEFVFKCDNNKQHNYIISSDLFHNRKMFNTIICTKCNPSNSSKSGLEQQLFEFLKSNYSGIIDRNKKLIKPQEIDIYLPEFNIGIEFNGLWWHNEINKSKNYHKEKSELSNKNGIKLIHIYEDDWLYKQNIIKTRLLDLINKNIKIKSDNCLISEIRNVDTIKDFLIENHINGYKGSQYNFGLYLNDNLFSIMCFDKNNKLIRYCDKNFHNVDNSFEKLFNFFILKYNINTVYSYYDIGWNNNYLEKYGFKKIRKIPPIYYYNIDGIRKKKIAFKNTNKYFKIYDSGGIMMMWKPININI
jgi:hypothetical protein